MKSFFKLVPVLVVLLSIVSCTDNTPEELIEESISVKENIKNLKAFHFSKVDPDDDGTDDPDDEE